MLNPKTIIKNLSTFGLICIFVLSFSLIFVGTSRAECVMYGIIGDDDPAYQFPDGLMYNEQPCGGL
jgi:hypothetical protein